MDEWAVGLQVVRFVWYNAPTNVAAEKIDGQKNGRPTTSGKNMKASVWDNK